MKFQNVMFGWQALAWLALPHVVCCLMFGFATSSYLCIGSNTPVNIFCLCTFGTCERVPSGTLRPGMGGPRYAAPDAAGLSKHVTNGQNFFLKIQIV